MPPVNSTGKKEAKIVEFVNRGAAGLRDKIPEDQKEDLLSEAAKDPFKLKGCKAKDRIAPDLKSLANPVDKFTPDPENARLHPEQNMGSIILSLYLYGQQKPIVVRKQTMVVVAGNGTLAAAKHLGWKTIAASIVDMSEEDAATYGIADNRTAELARWHTEKLTVVAKLTGRLGLDLPGFSSDDLQILRASVWEKPTIDPNASFEGKENPQSITFDDDQYAAVEPAIAHMREIQKAPEMSQAEVLRLISTEWLKAEKCGRLEGLDDITQEEQDAT